jgi:anti-sigma B factor antagonist
MHTTVGIFATRERAEEALVRLLENHIPEDRIVYLTRSEQDAATVSGRMHERAFAASRSQARETGRLTPNPSPVFALGFGDKTPLPSTTHPPFGLSTGDPAVLDSLVASASSEDRDFFQRVLDGGNSAVVVRTNSAMSAAAVCEIFDTFALHMRRSGSTPTSVILRRLSGGALAEFSGKIALGEGTALLRESIQNLVHFGYRHILLDLEHVDYLDSAGLGELVRSHVTVRGHGRTLKLVKPSAGVLRLLQMTRLDRVFEIVADQPAALRALQTSA